MATLSLCMIVKNEQEVLARCLDSVHKAMDEIVIVDTGSTDDTMDIARRYTDHVYSFPWQDHFSMARNFSFAKATQDYIMWLDADDILIPEELEKLIELKKRLTPDIDGMRIKYATGFDEAGRITFSYYRERIVKRACNFQWKEPVHEYIEVSGNIGSEDICVYHRKPSREGQDTLRNLTIYQNRIAAGEELSPRGQYYYARELFHNGRYEQAAAQYQKFLSGGQGWVEDQINACMDLATCYARANQPQARMRALLDTLALDLPRPIGCCEIAKVFMDEGKWHHALYWLTLALGAPTEGQGFVQHEYRKFVPYLQMTVCYDRLGNREAAQVYHEHCKAMHPQHPSVLFNEAYFKRIEEEAAQKRQQESNTETN